MNTTTPPDLVTADLLRSWEACDEGLSAFSARFPEGATLAAAIAAADLLDDPAAERIVRELAVEHSYAGKGVA